MSKTTIETLTTKQIKALRTDAAQHGDDVQVALCDIALADGIAEIAEIADSVRSSLERMGIVPEHVDADIRARAALVEAINLKRAGE